MTTVYGIKNCDTVKKACTWLNQHNIIFQLHDFRKDGLTKTKVNDWLKSVDWEVLLNKRGTTWRKLSDQQKENFNKKTIVDLMVAEPTLIKRPVLEHDGQVMVGFSIDTYNKMFCADE
jgi:arsenate reductase